MRGCLPQAFSRSLTPLNYKLKLGRSHKITEQNHYGQSTLQLKTALFFWFTTVINNIAAWLFHIDVRLKAISR